MFTGANYNYSNCEDHGELSENDVMVPDCKFPMVPKMSPEVKSLLEISESMDVAFLRAKLPSSKHVHHCGPWIHDNDTWLPRNQRGGGGGGGNGRKQNGAKLHLSKRNSTSDENKYRESFTSGWKSHPGAQSSKQAMDPYFKTGSGTLTIQTNSPTLRLKTAPNAASSSKHPDSSDNNSHNEFQPCHQSPSLPTLISLQSPANKDFHSAFSLGKVEFNGKTTSSSNPGPRLSLCTSHPASDGDVNARMTKSAGLNASTTTTTNNNTTSILEQSFPLAPIYTRSNTLPEICSRKTIVDPSQIERVYFKRDMLIPESDRNYSTSPGSNANRFENRSNALVLQDSNNNSNCSDPTKKTIKNCVTAYGQNYTSANHRMNTIKTPSFAPFSTASTAADYFDQMTSPPENPKILKILSQRNPAPPMCEFEDISVHIRHYRMYHTVRFTGQFSPANNQIQQEIAPVQWSEVFPHRPLSVPTNAATRAPVFRLRVRQDFDAETKTHPHHHPEHPEHPGEDHDDAPTFPGPLGIATDRLEINATTLGIDGKEREIVGGVVVKRESGEIIIGPDHPRFGYVQHKTSPPNFKDKNVKIDLSPTVTPVMKVSFRKNKGTKGYDACVGEKGIEDERLDLEDDYETIGSGSVSGTKSYWREGKEVEGNTRINDCSDTNASINDCSKDCSKLSSGTISTKPAKGVTKRSEAEINTKDDDGGGDAQFSSGHLVFEPKPENEKQEETRDVKQLNQRTNDNTLHSDSTNSGIKEENEQNTNNALFSYKEFVKRPSSINASNNRINYNPRVLHSRDSVVIRDRNRVNVKEENWIYPRRHGMITLLGSANGVRRSGKVIVDEERLKTSVDEKINRCRLLQSNSKLPQLQQKPPPNKYSDQTGSRFVRFMIKQQQYNKHAGVANVNKDFDDEEGEKEEESERRDISRDRCYDYNEDRDDTVDVPAKGKMKKKKRRDTESPGIVSTYDFNEYDPQTETEMDGDDVIEKSGRENPCTSNNSRQPNEETCSDPPVPTDKTVWCPKLSCLSARSRAASRDESSSRASSRSRRELISSAFRLQPVSPTSSAFVIAVPPPKVGFDDRGLVLPLQDFIHLAMTKGNDRTTFSELSKSINRGSKVGISTNTNHMMIRSSSGRRAMDDGLVRVVSFASPVNQFIFAKRITGFSSSSQTPSRGLTLASLSDGASLDAEDKARSVFQRKSPGSFRLRLKDGGVNRPSSFGRNNESRSRNETGDFCGDEQNNVNDELGEHEKSSDEQGVGGIDYDPSFNQEEQQVSVKQSKEDKEFFEEIRNSEDDDFNNKIIEEEDGGGEFKSCDKKHYDIYLPKEENGTNTATPSMNEPETTRTTTTNEPGGMTIELEVSRKETRDWDITKKDGDDSRKRSGDSSDGLGAFGSRARDREGNSSSQIERGKTATSTSLRQRIVKLAELRTSSQLSNHDNDGADDDGDIMMITDSNTDCTRRPVRTECKGYTVVDQDESFQEFIKGDTEEGIEEPHSEEANYFSLSREFSILEVHQTSDDNIIHGRRKSNAKRPLLLPQEKNNTGKDFDLLDNERRMSFHQKCARLRQRRAHTSLTRKSILKPGVVIRKDVVENNSNRLYHQTSMTSHSHPRLARGSCVVKRGDNPSDVTQQQQQQGQQQPPRPKTVRFECDGVEYRMVDREDPTTNATTTATKLMNE